MFIIIMQHPTIDQYNHTDNKFNCGKIQMHYKKSINILLYVPYYHRLRQSQQSHMQERLSVENDQTHAHLLDRFRCVFCFSLYELRTLASDDKVSL